MAFDIPTRADLAPSDDVTHGFGVQRHDDTAYADDDDWTDWPLPRRGNLVRRQAGEPRCAPVRATAVPLRRGPTRAARTGAESFKCGHCRAFVGPALLGGRHRNHCPRCLHSRHVDGKRPGDRAGDCGSLMAAVARFDRPDGEPVLIHRCLGCGFERHNRLAADDNILLLTRLPLVAPYIRRRPVRQDEAVSNERLHVS